jgi:two-component system chemotaxis response regulator CheY
LVLVDWNMPEMDGLAFVRAVRANPEHAGLRLMMITTQTEMVRVATALEAGADEYLMKPFTAEVLLDKLGILGISSP